MEALLRALIAYTHHCRHKGWKSPILQSQGLTLLWIQQIHWRMETKLGHAGQQAFCPFFCVRSYKSCSSLPAPARLVGPFTQAVHAWCFQLLRSLDQASGWCRWQCRSLLTWAILWLLWGGFIHNIEKAFLIRGSCWWNQSGWYHSASPLPQTQARSPPVSMGRPTAFARLWYKALVWRTDEGQVLEAWR